MATFCKAGYIGGGLDGGYGGYSVGDGGYGGSSGFGAGGAGHGDDGGKDYNVSFYIPVKFKFW